MKQYLLKKMIISVISVLIMSNVLNGYTFLSHVLQGSQPSVEQSAEQWQKQLAQQDGFAHWKDGKLSISPLGPGTHGWLVLVKQQDDVVGYMIVYSNEQEEFVLSEYGIGEPASLQFLSQHIARWHYFDYFHQVIPIHNTEGTTYIEPFMTEAFPINEQVLCDVKKDYEGTKKEYGSSAVPTLITGSLHVPYFPPYDVMPWLTSDPLNNKFEDDTSIEVLIELGSQLRFTTESWNQSVLSVYSITGYHEWNEFDLFIALQQEEEAVTRYIPYDALMTLGYFYDHFEE